MIIFDFIYFCIYSFVPNKAIFGKRDVACTFFSLSTAFFIEVFIICCSLIFDFKVNVAVLCVALFGGLFVLARMIFLRPIKFKNMHRRFRRVPKWLLKTIGIAYVLFCFFGSMFLSILTTKIIG